MLVEPVFVKCSVPSAPNQNTPALEPVESSAAPVTIPNGFWYDGTVATVIEAWALSWATSENVNCSDTRLPKKPPVVVKPDTLLVEMVAKLVPVISRVLADRRPRTVILFTAVVSQTTREFKAISLTGLQELDAAMLSKI